MKVIVNGRELEGAIRMVRRAMYGPARLMATTCIYMVTDESGRLVLTATNLEVEISAAVGCTIHEEGVCCVPARLLADYVQSVAQETISISTEKDNRKADQVAITAGRSRATIKVMDPADFPLASVSDEAVASFVMSAEGLRSLINRSAFAAAKDEARPILAGCQLGATEDLQKAVMAGVDGFRMAIAKVPFSEPPKEKFEPRVISARALSEIARAVQIGDSDVVVSLGLNSAVFSKDKGTLVEVRVVSQYLRDSQYPKWETLIPEQWQTRAIIDCDSMQRAVKMASLFAGDDNKRVDLQLEVLEVGEEGKQPAIGVSGASDTTGSTTNKVFLVGLEGEQSSIAFNAKYLVDVLSVMGSPQAYLQTSELPNPAVIKPVDNDDFVYVLMPILPVK